MSALPYLETVDILHGGPAGDVVKANVAVSLWPLLSARETTSGETYNWTGEAEPSAAAELIGKNNRSLRRASGQVLKVIAAVEHELLPHVGLSLSENRPGG